MKYFRKQKIKSIIIIGIIVLMISTGVFFAIGPKQIKAQTDTPAIEKASILEMTQKETHKAAAAAKETAKEAKDRILRKIKEALMRTVAITLKNTLIYFVQEMGRQSMEYLATGSHGQGPMFYDKTFSYFKDTLIGAASQEILDELAYSIWSETGFDICDPDVGIKMMIMYNVQLSLPHPTYERVAPRCEWNKVRSNWEGFYEDVRKNVEDIKGPTFAAMGAMQDSLDPRQNEFGVLLKVLDENITRREEQYERERDERMAPSSLKGKTSLVTKTVETPPFVIEPVVRSDVEAIKASRKTELKSSEVILTEIPEQVAFAFIQSFGPQNFLKAVVQRIFGGLVKKAESFNPKQQVFETKKAIQKVNTEILTADFSFEPRDVSLIDEFVNCPAEGSPGGAAAIPRGINDCVMDRNFAEAVRRSSSSGEAMTIQQAIKEGLLDPNKPFFSSSDPENNDPKCYQFGYCYSNLKKLRKARIIPIGWEITAEKTVEVGNKSLQDVINEFNNENSAFYRLIDPSWVLKEPINQCRANVYGPDLMASGAEDRPEVCADYRTCIEETPNGDCIGGFGYCAEEERTWRLDGDTCDSQYAGCNMLYDRNGVGTGWILNTLDPVACSASDVGCQLYSLWKNYETGDGEWAKLFDVNINNDANDKWIFLNKNIENELCSPEKEGCARFIRTAADLGANLIYNSGFEEVPENADLTDLVNVPNWGDINISDQIFNTGSYGTFFGKNTLNTAIISKYINVVPKDYDRYYVLSAYGYRTSDLTEISCILQTSDGVLPVTQRDSFLDSGPTVLETWTRKSWIFNIPGDTNTAIIQVKCNPGNLLVDVIQYLDDIQLEEVLDPNLIASYNDYATVNATYLKQSPDYYNCYDGNPNTNHFNCDNFIPICEAVDVGCETYTPTDNGAAQNAVVGRYNYCPAECNGYETFSQSETFFEPSKFPLYFIPATARQCSEQNIGCEAYTNIDVLEVGGEAVSYFKQIRQCSKPGPDCATFYTWEGSEVTGYQIQSHSLRDINGDNNPDVTNSALDSQNCNPEIFAAQTNPDCRQFYNKDGAIFYHLKSLTISCDENCSPHRLEVDAGDIAASNSKCVSSNGEWDDATNKCIYDIIVDEAITCPIEEAGCREYKGNFAGDIEILHTQDLEDFDPNNWLRGELSSESFALGGKSYRIPQTAQTGESSVRYRFPGFPDPEQALTLFANEQYQLEIWIKPNLDDTADIADIENLDINGFETEIDLLGLSRITLNINSLDWAAYGLIVKPTSDTPVNSISFTNMVKQIPGTSRPAAMGYFIDNIKIKKIQSMQNLIRNTWSTPETCDMRLDTFDPLSQAMLGCREYKDRAGNLHYLRSYNNFCDFTVVGCEALIDTNNSLPHDGKVYENDPIDLCNFAPIMIDESLGRTCRMKLLKYLCAENSDWVNLYAGDSNPLEACLIAENIIPIPFSELQRLTCATIAENTGDNFSWINQSCINTDASPAFEVHEDEYVYRVISEENSCAAEDKGCTAAAMANLDYDLAITDDWFETHIKIDPDNLDAKICDNNSVRCEEYVDSNNNIYYFKNPGLRYCEYRTDPAGDGWFEAGSDTRCANIWQPYNGIDMPLPYYHWDYRDYTLLGTDDNYEGWPARCPEEADTCTAFIDSAAKTSDSPIGHTYFLKNNEKIDKESCENMVDPGQGCVLFLDTSDPAGPQWSSELSNFENAVAGEAIPPIAISETTDVNSTVNSLSSESITATARDFDNYFDWIDDLKKAEQSVILDMASDKNTHYVQINKSTGAKIADAFNDANVVLKVKQDRQCSKWYTCLGPSYVWDQNAGQWVEICELIGLCDEYGNEGGGAYCKHVVLPKDGTIDPLNQRDYFTVEDYQNRQSAKYAFLDKYIDIYTPEYSGMTIVNNFPLQYLRPVDLNQNVTNEDSYYTLVGDMNQALDGDPCTDIVSDMLNAVAPGLADRLPPSAGNSLGGKCYAPKNLFETLNSTTAERWPDAKLCRAYPREDTPFPVDAVFESFLSEKISKHSKYRNASNFGYNLTEMTAEQKATDYGCRYKEVKYGSGQITLFLPPDMGAPAAICEKTQKPCECLDQRNPESPICMKSDCAGTQSCLQKELSITDLYGWEGYCLEEDESINLFANENKNPCLTWYPVDMTIGLSDHYNQYGQAGYSSNELPYYCLTAEPYLQEKAYFSGCTANEPTGAWHGFLAWTDTNSNDWSYGNCESKENDNPKLWTEWLYEKIQEAATDFEAETPDEKLYSVSKAFGEFLSTAGINHEEGWYSPSGDKDANDQIEMGEIRAEMMSMIVSYYFSAASDHNSSDPYYNRDCGDGYFPVFAPCGDAWENSPGMGYKCDSKEAGGVLCVPFNSYIDIPDAELTKWKEMKPIGIDISVFQGAECRPHITRGELLKKGSVQLGDKEACFDNSQNSDDFTWFNIQTNDDGDVEKICQPGDGVTVSTAYDMIVAVDNGYKSYWPSMIPKPAIWLNWAPRKNKSEIINSVFSLRVSDTGGPYFWRVRDKSELKDGPEEYLYGTTEWSGGNSSDGIWYASLYERGWDNINFDFIVPLYRYCVQKTPVINSYNVYTDADHKYLIAEFIERESIEAEDAIKVSDADPVWDLPAEYRSIKISESAMNDTYLSGEGQLFATGHMLCSHLAEVENTKFEDKAWTDKLYNNQLLKRLDSIEYLTQGEPDSGLLLYDNLRFYLGSLPFNYGQTEMPRFVETELNDEFAPAATCAYNTGEVETSHPSLLHYRMLLNPELNDDFEGTDVECSEVSFTTTSTLLDKAAAKAYNAYRVEGGRFPDCGGGLDCSIDSADGLSMSMYYGSHPDNGMSDYNFGIGTPRNLRMKRPLERLQLLFAKVFDVWRWQSVFENSDNSQVNYSIGSGVDADDNNRWYRGSEYKSDKNLVSDMGGIDSISDQNYYKYTDDASYSIVKDGSGGYAPQVTGVELRPGKKYRAVPRTITLETESERKHEGALYSGLDNRGQLVVNTKFFGWADNNHMPIKSVRVHWGDGADSISGGAKGQYKNHKAVCATAADQEISYCEGGESARQETCFYDDDCSTLDCGGEQNSGVRFGAVPNACTMSYFQKTHVYSCADSATASGLPPCGDESAVLIILGENWDEVPVETGCYASDFIPGVFIDGAPMEPTGACLYRPGAQVLDNWGWCNGDCEGDGQGCYNDGVDGPGGFSAGYCELSDFVHQAYTRYNGIVVVIP